MVKEVRGYNCQIEYIAGTTNTIADLLSRPVDAYSLPVDDIPVEPDINDNIWQVRALNSNRFEPKQFASYESEIDEQQAHEQTFLDFDVCTKQKNDAAISELRTQLVQGTVSKSIDRQHILLDNKLYYISDPDNQALLRLYIYQQVSGLKLSHSFMIRTVIWAWIRRTRRLKLLA